ELAAARRDEVIDVIARSGADRARAGLARAIVGGAGRVAVEHDVLVRQERGRLAGAILDRVRRGLARGRLLIRRQLLVRALIGDLAADAFARVARLAHLEGFTVVLAQLRPFGAVSAAAEDEGAWRAEPIFRGGVVSIEERTTLARDEHQRHERR